jgi:large subunit ribosomal protein L4
MIRIQEPRTLLKSCYFTFSRCRAQNERGIVTSAVESFLLSRSSATGTPRSNGSYLCSVPVETTRFFSASTSNVKPQHSQKVILPSNLILDPRSSFVNLFQRESADAVNEDEYNNDSAIDAASLDDGDEEDNDEDDMDDDEELFMPSNQNGLILPYGENIVYAKPLPERLKVEIHSLFRSPSMVGTIHLNGSVFGLDPIRVDLLKRSVDYYRAKKRGLRKHKTKTIGEVSGSGRKIRNQKGGGVARAGHSRPPHFRGGAKAHGPKNVTDYANTKLNKKVRRLATRHVFSQKLKEGNLILLNHMYELQTHKTGDLVRLLDAWKIGGSVGSTALLLDHYYSDDTPPTDPTFNADAIPSSLGGVPTNLHVAAGNIQGLTVANSHGANVYSILKHEKLILTLSALEQIENRLKDD